MSAAVVEEFRGYEEDCPKMAEWVRLLARLGKGDLSSEAAEARATELEVDGKGFGELADAVQLADDAVDDPDKH